LSGILGASNLEGGGAVCTEEISLEAFMGFETCSEILGFFSAGFCPLFIAFEGISGNSAFGADKFLSASSVSGARPSLISQCT
jgi:hypothetical protein